MSLFEGEPEGEETGSICEGLAGGGGAGRKPSGDVQHELSPGAEICRDRERDNGKDQGLRTLAREKEKVVSSEFGVRSQKHISSELGVRSSE